MVHALSQISWIGVALAFMAYFILGALWFTVLFSKSYRISLGKENEPQQKPAPIFIVGPAVCSLIMTITHSILIHALDIHSITGAVEFGIIAGLGYLVANIVNIAINPNIPKPLFYGLITGTYHLTGITIVSIILVFMY